MRHLCSGLLTILLIAVCLPGMSCRLAAQDQVMTPELLWKLGRLGDSVVTSDGQSIWFTVRTYELSENSGTTSLHRMNADGSAVAAVLTDWKSIGAVQLAPHGDGDALFFTGIPPASESDDEDDEETDEDEPDFDASPQVYRLAGGSEPVRISSVEDGVSNVRISPTGKHVSYTADVKLDDTVNDLFEDLPEADARIIDGLMYRHWNAWHDYKYSHLMVAPIDDDGMVGPGHDLMTGQRVDTPVPPFGGSEQIAWAPDGSEICYTAKMVEAWAESTDSDLYLVRLNADGSPAGDAICITEGREGYDNNPLYSPDGKYIAFNSMARPSFESDRNMIMLFERDTGGLSELTGGLDQNANHPHWVPDSSGLIFGSEFRGANHLFQMDIGDTALRQLTEGQFNWDIVDELPGTNQLLVTKTSMIRPAELFNLSLQDKSYKKLSGINDDIYTSLQLPTLRERWVEATDGKQIHCWVIYPPGFDESKKYPMITYCQGGPQGQIGQWFSYRWNFHLMAANGYVIVAPNRRGLPGFGREWNDQISGDWGGQAMKDLLSATDNMLNEPFVDREKVGAIGASFGGYTVYWMMGNHEDRFAAMIAHCGVFNLESMYGSTEELFFVNWDLGGPYWKSPDIQKEYDQFSPHKFVKNWKTPLMVIHGQKDFRVPVTQGMEAFTAAQVQGVESRFLYFPDEGHWVLSPQNGVLWHRLFFDWLDRFLK